MLARLKPALRPFRLYRAARFGWHFATDPVFRRDHVLLWRRPKNLFQHRSITLPDRYPVIFDFVQRQLGASADLRLLSFGCAMGDEVFSLRGLFPRAAIKGIDINPANIAAARARQRAAGAASDSSIVFECGGTVAAEPSAHYDAVFCMAVFVRWQIKTDPNVKTCAPHLRFADYEAAVTDLARTVRPGGLLVLRYSMFRFADTAIAREFRPVLSVPMLATLFTPRFDRHDLRVPDETSEQAVFQKN